MTWRALIHGDLSQRVKKPDREIHILAHNLEENLIKRKVISAD